MGCALGSVRSINVQLDDTRRRSVSRGKDAAALSSPLCMLASACPALTSLTCSEQLYPAFLQRLGQSCPVLSSLTLPGTFHYDVPLLHRMVSPMASFLTQLTSLAIPALRINSPCFLDGAERDADVLPDLTQLTSLLSLDLDHCSLGKTQWPFLPPNLRHLRCSSMSAVPLPRPDGSSLFHKLLSLEIHSDVPLWLLARILRCAPALQSLKSTGMRTPVLLQRKEGPAQFHDPQLSVLCRFRSITATDMSLLKQRIEAGLICDATYKLECGTVFGIDADPFIADLPRMSGMTRVELHGLRPGFLVHLLSAFPDVQRLTIATEGPALDDVTLQGIAACPQLSELTLYDCDSISPAGLQDLCVQLPLLRSVTYAKCAQIHAQALEGCVKYLQQRGLSVDIVVDEKFQSHCQYWIMYA